MFEFIALWLLPDPPVLYDDFNDGAVSDLWEVVETNQAVISLAEQNGRLEFPAQPVGTVSALEVALLAGDGWGVDATQDFCIRVDYHADVPATPEGPTAAYVFIELSFDPLVPYVADGFWCSFGMYFPPGGLSLIGPAAILHRRASGEKLLMDLTGLDAATGSVYLRHDARAGLFSWSPVSCTATGESNIVEFFDAFVGNVFQVRIGGSAYFLDGWTEMSVAPDQITLDNFVIEYGTIVDTSCSADVDASGSVDVTDLVGVITAWGETDSPYDVAPAGGNGIVDVEDLLAVLLAWGPCSF